MGERTEYNAGDQAPNDAVYIEVGEASFHTEIMNPKQVKLKKGDHFPETTNKDRKWKKKSHAMVH